MDAGGDEDEEATTTMRPHRKRPEPHGTERLVAEEVDENLTDLLFGEMSEPPRRER
jgi:hypothetical protein